MGALGFVRRGRTGRAQGRRRLAAGFFWSKTCQPGVNFNLYAPAHR